MFHKKHVPLGSRQWYKNNMRGPYFHTWKTSWAHSYYSQVWRILIRSVLLGTNLGNPHFLFLKCNQHARIKLSAKFEKILWSAFWAILSNLNFAESLLLACWSPLFNEKLGSPSLFFRYEHMQLKPKYRVFFQGLPVTVVTCDVLFSYNSFIDVLHGTITWYMIRDKVL